MIVVLTAAIGFVGPSGAAALTTDAVFLTDQLTWDGSSSTRLPVQTQAPFTVDLTQTDGARLPQALVASHGAGFVGFALIGQGANDDAFALAVRLPEPDGQGDPLGIAYGRSADGALCTVCTFPAGTFELLLLTGGESSDAPTTVDIRLVTGDSTVTALPRLGVEARAVQRGRTSSRPDTPLLPGVSGFSELSNMLDDSRGVMVDQRLVQVTGRTVPALLSWAEFCHGPSSDRQCLEHESHVGDVRWTTSNVTPFDLGPEETINSWVAYTSAGNIDFYVSNQVLFIGL